MKRTTSTTAGQRLHPSIKLKKRESKTSRDGKQCQTLHLKKTWIGTGSRLRGSSQSLKSMPNSKCLLRKRNRGWLGRRTSRVWIQIWTLSDLPRMSNSYSTLGFHRAWCRPSRVFRSIKKVSGQAASSVSSVQIILWATGNRNMRPLQQTTSKTMDKFTETRSLETN